MNKPASDRHAIWIGLGVVVGLFLCLILLWFFAFRGPSIRSVPESNVARKVKEYRETVQADESEGMAARFLKRQQEWVRMSSDLVGSDRRVAEAISEVFEKIAPQVQAYDEAYQAVAQAGFAMPVFENQQEVAARIALLRTFAEANQRLLADFQSAETNLRKTLESKEVTPRTAETNVRAFLKNGKIEEVIRIREIDAELADRMLQSLTLLNQEWGKWTADDNGNVDFHDDAVEEAFNKIRGEIDTLAEEQNAVQEKILAR